MEPNKRKVKNYCDILKIIISVETAIVTSRPDIYVRHLYIQGAQENPPIYGIYVYAFHDQDLPLTIYMTISLILLTFSLCLLKLHTYIFYFYNMMSGKGIQHTTGKFAIQVHVTHKSEILFREMALQEPSLGSYSYLFISIIPLPSPFHLIH